MVAGRWQPERRADSDSADFVRLVYRPRIWTNLNPANKSGDPICPEHHNLWRSI